MNTEIETGDLSETQFSHSVKIEQTAKGARVTVRVNANEKRRAWLEAIELYTRTKKQLEAAGEVLAVENGA